MDMTRKFEPRSGCWKLVDIIEDNGTDRDSKAGAFLPVFVVSEMKMNCEVENRRSTEIQHAPRSGGHATQLVGL